MKHDLILAFRMSFIRCPGRIVKLRDYSGCPNPKLKQHQLNLPDDGFLNIVSIG